jgi:putative transcriptional regulator
MVSFHPDSRFLTDFAAGNLTVSEALCVSAHLEFCAKCRAHVQQLNDLGAQLMSRQDTPAELAANDDDFAMLMQKIEHSPPYAATTEPKAADQQLAGQERGSVGAGSVMPRVVQKLMGRTLQELNWVQLGSSLRIAPFEMGQGDRETSLYDIKAGGRMPEHEHRGEEITVLLKGSFSDAEGKYVRGDFVVRHAGERHQPTATLDTDCICLVSLQRPVRPRSVFYRLLEPFVQYRMSGASN